MSEPVPVTVVLLGMMGSGETTVGQALSARTGWPYRDNDELVRAVTGRAPEAIDAADLEWLQARHAERDAAYREAATLSVDSDDLPAETVAETILAAIAAC